MTSYRVELSPLSDQEISQVERFLDRDTARTSSSLRRFLRGLEAELRRTNVLARRARIHIDDPGIALTVRERWLVMIRGPIGRNRWRPWSPLTLDVEVVEKARNLPLRPKFKFSIADHHLNLLLVRAIANGQIHKFIECELCGNVKHVKIVRSGERKFCKTDHRVRFHYLISRRGAKDLITERRKWREKGIPCSIEDIWILRKSGLSHGTRSAARILAQASIPLRGMDDAELKQVHRLLANK